MRLRPFIYFSKVRYRTESKRLDADSAFAL